MHEHNRRLACISITLILGSVALTSACDGDPPSATAISAETPAGDERVVSDDAEVDEEEGLEDEEEHQSKQLIEPRAASSATPRGRTVGDLIKARACSTGDTMDLNVQLAAEKNCIAPGSYDTIGDVENIKLGAGANPFLQSDAAASLRDVAAANPRHDFVINSSWRSSVQQHILRRWRGRCGIRVAARPGRSHHESGLAIDVTRETTRDFRKTLKKNDWEWYCDRTNRGRFSKCRDIPHHTFKGEDLRALNVLAFQRLWNNDHPEDIIAENGEYDDATARRMDKAPLAGFEAGPTCNSDAFIARVYNRPTAKDAERATLAAAALIDSATQPQTAEVSEEPTATGSLQSSWLNKALDLVGSGSDDNPEQEHQE